MRSRRTLAFLVLLIAVVSFVAAGCGGTGGSPAVADLGATGTTTDPASAGAPSGDSGPGSSSGGGGLMIGGSNSIKYSRCMRAHGVSNFPDPNSQGQIQIGPNSGIDTSSSTFRAAAQACQNSMGGNGPRPSPAQQAKIRREALAFSACMRKHGVPDFPDPTFSGGKIGIRITSNSSGDLNPNSPTFQAAQQACQGKLPFRKQGATSSGGAR